jgi:hypothetical protein
LPKPSASRRKSLNATNTGTKLKSLVEERKNTEAKKKLANMLDKVPKKHAKKIMKRILQVASNKLEKQNKFAEKYGLTLEQLKGLKPMPESISSEKAAEIKAEFNSTNFSTLGQKI